MLQGRILVYQVRENKLHQVCERETKGSVFCLAAFQVPPSAIRIPAAMFGRMFRLSACLVLRGSGAWTGRTASCSGSAPLDLMNMAGADSDTLSQGKLLAGVSAKVQLYRWAQRDDGSRELVNECNHAGHVYVLYMATRGDFILVGAFAP